MNRERDWELLRVLQMALGSETLLDEVMRGLEKNAMNEILDYISQMHDIEKK